LTPRTPSNSGQAVVAVVGSANLDLVAHVPHRPAPGETVLGSGFEQHAGGKGLNQALAAARVAPTAFVGLRGDDDAGDLLLAALVRHGVDTTRFAKSAGASGRALITVTPDAENSITVLPEANSRLTGTDVTAALDALRPSLVLSQQEISSAALTAGARWASLNGARFSLNASPNGPLDEPVLRAADPLIVNESEARQLTGDSADPRTAAQELARRSRSVVVTLGGAGCLIAWQGRLEHVPAPKVTPVDTTGAGDTFAGVLAAHLVSDMALVEAAALATEAAASVIVTARSER
jgi:ribokinase